MIKNTTTLKDTYKTAYESYKKGNLKIAETLCYKILSIDPNFVQTKLLLSNISVQNKDFVKAKKLLNEAIDMQPNNASALNNLGTLCKQLGEIKHAVDYYKKAIEVDPSNVNAYYNLGATCYDLKKLKEAKSYLQKTIDLQPNFALPYLVMGNVHVDLKEYENAVSNYQKATEINSKLPGAHNNLGLVFRKLNDYKNAIVSYKKAIEIKNDHTNAHHNLALAYKESGSFEKAINSHEMAIKYEPENLTHYFYLSDLKKNILNNNLKNNIEKIMKKKVTKNNIAYGNYLLSKYEKELKNYEKELNFLIKGHKFYFDSKKEKFEIMVKYTFENILQISNEVKVEKNGKGNINKLKPIFIIGVPRCGSTLVEKIIGSGTQFVPMGEETAILEEYVTSQIMKNQSLNLGHIDDVRNEIFNLYKKRGLISEKFNNVFTDKTLNNFFFLKLIKEVFPDAKIINCKRDVISSIMSIFQNQLTELAWAHDLDNIFKYFDNYLKLLENFNELYPNSIYELQFDKLVNNPEMESKKLMDFCELPWDKKCLEFYKRKDLISKTASNIQIRKAIYKHSLGRYLPYKKLLNKYGDKYSWFK